jgi:hypothetical protein
MLHVRRVGVAAGGEGGAGMGTLTLWTPPAIQMPHGAAGGVGWRLCRMVRSEALRVVALGPGDCRHAWFSLADGVALHCGPCSHVFNIRE